MKSIRAAAWAAFAVVGLASQAFAATVTVTNLNDAGAGSLRAALAAAGAGDTIQFAPGVTGTIPLLSTLPVASDVIIEGPGIGSLTLDGQGAVQVLNIAAGTLTISGVTVANGIIAGQGGGISVAGAGAGLIVSNSVFTGNTAANGGAIQIGAGGTGSVDESTFTNNSANGVGGGAIIVFGTLALSNSTFVGNTAPINGGAINVQPGGDLAVVNSTFSGNISTSLGGALSTLGALTVDDSTFSANQGSAGAAIAAGGAYTVNNSVFVDNAGTVGSGAFTPAPTTASNNVFFNNTNTGVPDDLTGYGTTNAVVATAQPLRPLGNYGGPTQTMPAIAGGAASCAGDPALLPPGLTRDQRGGPRVNGTCLDAGSVQALLAIARAVPALSLPWLVVLAAFMGFLGLRRGRFTA